MFMFAFNKESHYNIFGISLQSFICLDIEHDQEFCDTTITLYCNPLRGLITNKKFFSKVVHGLVVIYSKPFRLILN